MSQFFAPGGQRIGVSALASVPSNEYSRLISFRIDWLDLLAVQGTLKSLLQHQSSKASILWYSVFFIVQISHPYMTTGKTIALTRWTFVSKVMSVLFNMLSRLVLGFLLESSFKKIRDTKGTFHAKMAIIKGKNSMDLTEAEDTKKEEDIGGIS